MSPRASLDPSLPVVLALGAAALLPFAGKAFHVDDPSFLWAARHLSLDPLDAWGYTRVWGGQLVPAHLDVNHPPLNAYLTWLGTTLFGFRELPLHLLFIGVALAALGGTHALARRLGAPAGLASLVLLATPVFLVSSGTLMSDTLFLATWVWAAVAFVDALAAWSDPARRGAAWRGLALSMLAAIACLMTRYNGIALVPLLAAYGLAARRRIEPWLAALAAPVLAFAAYQGAAFAQHGHVPIRSAAEYARRSDDGLAPGMALLVGLVYAGGCPAPVASLAPLLWARRTLALAGAAAIAVGASVALGLYGAFGAPGGAGAWPAGLQIGPWLVAGAAAVALAGVELARRRDAGTLLLALWLIGTFAFATLFNWTVNARSFLPMGPAVAILAARRIAEVRPRASRAALATALGVAGILGLGVAVADARSAGAARSAARELIEKTAGEGGQRWVRASWGLQYYLEAAGFRSIDPLRSRLAAGDLVVAPLDPRHDRVLPRELLALESTIPPQPLGILATMDASLGAGFYASATFGPLPFAFGRPRSEEIGLFRVERGFAFEVRGAR